KSTKPSETASVDKFMKALDHPLTDVLEALRQIILKTDPEVGEEIKWNAPTFFFTGAMEPSNPKEYKRYLVVSNVFKKDSIRLVFWQGAGVKDTSGFLQGDYTDGRRLATFHSVEDVEANKATLQDVIKQQLSLLDK